MDKVNKLDKSSRTLVILSFLGVGLSLMGSYYLSRRSTLSNENMTPIAEIKFYKNDTRVKRSSDIHWNNITEVADCFKNDRIFTGPDSEATILFPGGMEIKLHPNSLIILSDDLVELDSGTIDINITGKKTLDVMSFGEKFTAEKNSNIRLVQEKSEKKLIALNKTAQDSISVKPGLKNLVVNSADAKKPKKPTYAPISIRLNSKLDFTVNPVYKAVVVDQNFSDEYKITLKKSNGEVLKELKSKVSNLNLSTMEDGDYQLAVEGIIKGQVIGQTSTPFTVRSTTYPAPEIPGDYRSFTNEDKEVPLTWKPLEKAESYQVDISDGQKENVVSSNQTVTADYNYKITKPGLFYWRVRYKVGEAYSSYSKYSEIEIKDTVTLINRPLMIAPVNDSRFEFKNDKVNFTWSEPDPKLTYTFELYSDPNARPIKSLKVKKGRLGLVFKDTNATFWWRVFASSPFGNDSLNKDKNRFTITPKPIPVVVKKTPKATARPIIDGIDYIQLKGRKPVQDSEW